MRTILRIINIFLSIFQMLLWARFILKLLAISGNNSVIAWIYTVTAKLITPVAGIFPPLSVGKFTLELTTLFAILVYAIIHFIIGRIARASE